MAKLDFSIIGDSGLKRSGGRLYEEQLRKLSGTRAAKIYAEMSQNDPVIGSILFAIEMLCRQVQWSVEPASDNSADAEPAQFLEECMSDMSHSWPDLISEILTMLINGWAYHELVYKYRQGPDSADPSRRSKFTDGKIGWRKIPLRAQESLDRWEFQDDGGIAGMHQTVMYGTNPGNVFIPIEKALLFRTKIIKNSPEGVSVLRTSFRPWFFKKRIEEVEAIGIERDLAGLPVAEVPPELLSPDATTAQKAMVADLKVIVSEIRRDEREGLVVPAEEVPNGQGGNEKTGFRFRLLNSGGSRQIDVDKTITRYEQRIAMTVLAEFILLGLDKVGSFSLVSSKMNLFATALDAWLDSIAEVFNRFAIPRLFAANGWKLEQLPKLQHGPVQDLSIDELGVFLEKLGRAGFPLVGDDVLENHLRRKANLPPKEPGPV